MHGQVNGVYLGVRSRGSGHHLVLGDPLAADDDQREARLAREAQAEAQLLNSPAGRHQDRIERLLRQRFARKI